MEQKYRKGVFFIVYTIGLDDKILYLALKRKAHWIGWEFPKAGMEIGETPINTVKRELNEETGLKPKSIKKFEICGKFNYSKEYAKERGLKGQTYEALFAVEIDYKKIEHVKIDHLEHSNFKWLTFQEAIKRLKWKNQSECIKIVQEWIMNKKYAGFRKKITNSGNLLLAGKDKNSNEKLINNFVQERDLVLHTQKPGSAFVIIKGEKINKKDIKEAAIFCAKYSHDFRDNNSNVNVHYFLGKDIYKDKSMKIGTFGVKNFKEIKIIKEEIK